MKSFLLVSALCVAVSYGAVIPSEEDALFEMAQSFLAAPEEFATALGMTRVKRSAYDKAFNFPGMSIGIDYIDPANQLKGGKLDIKIDNLKKYFPKAKSEQVDLSINFNGGDNAKDGLFTMSVDYELNHVNKEQGTLNVERTSDGKTWTTKVSVKSKNNAAVKIITPFDMTLKSDRKTFMDGVVKCSQGETYTIKVNRVPGKKMDVIVEGMGKTYIVNGVRDGKKKITIDIDAAGIKQTVELNNNSNGDKIAFSGDFNMGPYGAFNIVLDVNRDGKSGKMDVRMGSAVVFSAVLKGKVDATKKSAKYEVRYALASREGKVRLSLVGQPNMEFSFQYLPKGSTDLKIKITRSKAGNVIQWSGLASRGGEEYLNYKNKIEYKEISDAFTLDVNSKFHVNDKSVLHPMFCTYGCFNDRSANMKVLVKKNTPYKLSVDIELFKDAQSVLTLDINTINNPYVFKVSAPRILPKILPTGNPSIEFTADHKPGSYLKVTSNTRSLKSFSVVKVAGSNERKIELNGKELVRAGFAKGDNEISNTVTLPNGKSLTTTLSWERDDMTKNKVHLNLDGTERKLDLVAEWNFQNQGAMTFDVNANGENKRIGAYSFSRKGQISATNGKLNGAWKGQTAAAKVAWMSPVDTDVSFDLNSNTNSYVFNISKTAAGRKMSISYNNGRFSIDF